jgi:hypothetical protein
MSNLVLVSAVDSMQGQNELHDAEIGKKPTLDPGMNTMRKSPNDISSLLNIHIGTEDLIGQILEIRE